MAISGTKGQEWRTIPTQYMKASDILTSTLAAFLFSSHPKRERDREAHLNYYTAHLSYKQTLYLVKQQTKSLELCVELSIMFLENSHPYFQLRLVLRQLLRLSNQFGIRGGCRRSGVVVLK